MPKAAKAKRMNDECILSERMGGFLVYESDGLTLVVGNAFSRGIILVVDIGPCTHKKANRRVGMILIKR